MFDDKDKISFNEVRYSTANLTNFRAKFSDKKWDPLFKFYTGSFTEKERKENRFSLYFCCLPEQEALFDVKTLEDVNENSYFDTEDIIAFKNSHPEFENLTVEDLDYFFRSLVEESDKEIQEHNEEIAKRYADIPEAVREYIDDNTIVTKTPQGYLLDRPQDFSKALYSTDGELVATNDYNYMCKIFGKGKCNTTYYHNSNVSAPYSPNEFGAYAELYQYEFGTQEFYDYSNLTGYRQYGGTRVNFSMDEDLKETENSFEIESQYGGKTNFELIYDKDGKLLDIKAPENPNSRELNTVFFNNDTALDNETKEQILGLMNDGQRIGYDFTLVEENGKVKVKPIVFNKTQQDNVNVPDNITADYLEIIQDHKQGSDFFLEYTQNGFRLNFLNQTATDGVDFKRIDYSANGKVKTTTTYDNNEAIVRTETPNGVREEHRSRNDMFLEALLIGDVQSAEEILGYTTNFEGDFDFYEVCKKYQEMTGKSAMDTIIKYFDSKGESLTRFERKIFGTEICVDADQEPTFYREELVNFLNERINETREIRDFKIEDERVLNQILKREHKQNSDNEYMETVEGVQYHVKSTKNKITIKVGKDTYSIDTKGKPPLFQTMLMHQNPLTLVHLAKKGVKFNYYDSNNFGQTFHQWGTIDIADYNPEKNVMNLYTEHTNLKTIEKNIAHEAGHSFYLATSENQNPEFNEVSAEEYEAWQNSDEKYKSGAHVYCCTSPDELFAECYCLIMNGHCQSEYTITKYFPRTLAVVRKMILGNN